MEAPDLTNMFARMEADQADRARKYPDERAALNGMFEAYQRLHELGWHNAIYCPKDGTVFEAIESGSTGIFDCHYQGEWPDGSWWIYDGGDLWPSRPCLFRLKKETPTGNGVSEGA